MDSTLNSAGSKTTLTEQRPPGQLRRPPKLSKVLHLWHLLSLDAPTVAALWTYFIAATLRARIPRFAPFEMFLTVWIIYVCDRLLDGRQLNRQPFSQEGLEERHHFHHSHRVAFLLGIGGVAMPLAVLLLRIPGTAVHLYLLLAGLLLGYFVIIHVIGHMARVPKELAVGFIFASAVFIPTVATQPELRLALVPSGLLFAALCSLNCLFICSWEHERRRAPFQGATDAVTRIALRYLNQEAILIIIFGGILPFIDRRTPWEISFSCALAAMLMLQMHRNRLAFWPTTLRATADLVLLAPILFLPFLPPV